MGEVIPGCEIGKPALPFSYLQSIHGYGVGKWGSLTYTLSLHPWSVDLGKSGDTLISVSLTSMSAAGERWVNFSGALAYYEEGMAYLLEKYGKAKELVPNPDKDINLYASDIDPAWADALGSAFLWNPSPRLYVALWLSSFPSMHSSLYSVTIKAGQKKEDVLK